MAEQEKTSVVPGELGSFLFWANSPSGTYSELEAKRAAIAHLMAKQKGPPKNLGEGLTYLGESIGEAGLRARLEAAEAAYRAREEAAGRAPPGEKTYVNTDGTPVVPAPRSEAAPPAAKPVKTVDYTTTPEGRAVPKTPTPPAPRASEVAAPPVRPLSFSPTDEPVSADNYPAGDATAIPTPTVPPGLSDNPSYFGGNPITTAPVSVSTDDAANVLTPIEPGMPIRGDRPVLSPNERVRQGFEPGTPPSRNLMFDPRMQGDVQPPMSSPGGEQLAPYFAPPPGARPAPAPGPQASADPMFVPADQPNQFEAQNDALWAQRRGAISGIESGGAKNPYGLVGAVATKAGDRAYGKYQEMGKEIPGLTEKYYGTRLSPQQFLNNPDAQEAVFQGNFGRLAAKHGDENAARAWFGGEGGINHPGRTDVHGRLNIGQYGREYMARRGDIPSPDAAARVPLPPASPLRQPTGPTELASADQTMPTRALPFSGEPTNALPPLPPQGANENARAAITDLLARGDRSGGPDTVAQTQSFVPDTPPQNPTLPGRPSPATTSTAQASQALPGSSVLAQANPPMSSGIPVAPPAPALPPRLSGTMRGAGDVAGGAPRGGGGFDPSAEPIPPPMSQAYPDIGPEPVPPKMLGLSEKQQRLQKIINDRGLDPRFRQQAHDEFQLEEKFRTAIEQRQFEDYKNKRELWEGEKKAKKKWELEEPIRVLDERNKQLAVQKAAIENPYLRQKIEQEIEKNNIEIAQKRRDLAKPDTLTARGTQFERPYDTQGRPTGPYAVPPGAPQPKDDLTETQAKGVQFVMRVTPDLHALETEMANGKAMTYFKDGVLAANIPFGMSNKAVSDEYRRAHAAATNWGAAFLTHVSGQAVSPTEAERNLPAFIPRYGDTDRDLAEKAQRRRDMTASITQTTGDVGQGIIDKTNVEYMSRRPPVKVNSIEDIERLNLSPGQKLILPDGSPGVVPPPRKKQ